MDYGGNDRRKTKGDLKRKRLNRGYKRGGQFRAQNVDEVSGGEGKDVGKNRRDKGKGKGKNKKY